MKKLCSCGKEYWPNQAWIHAKCMVVNASKSESLVVNARPRDRHLKTPQRAAYIAQKMREYRKRRAASKVA